MQALNLTGTESNVPTREREGDSEKESERERQRESERERDLLVELLLALHLDGAFAELEGGALLLPASVCKERASQCVCVCVSER